MRRPTLPRAAAGHAATQPSAPEPYVPGDLLVLWVGVLTVGAASVLGVLTLAVQLIRATT